MAEEPLYEVSVQYEIDNSLLGSTETITTMDVYECGDCHKVLSSLASLKRHLRLHEPSNSRPKPVLKYSCEICGKFFQTPSTLERHRSVHTGEQKYECEYCKKRFTQKAHYQCHLSTFHIPGGKKYKCPVEGCEYETVRRNAFTLHFKRHALRGTWACEQCGKAFVSEVILQRHILHHDDPSRRFECDVCGSLFSSAKLLKGHRKIHTQEFKATCQVCHAEFLSESGFRSHAQNKCGQNAYQFKCAECASGFNKEAALVAHIKQSHAPSDELTKTTYVCCVCQKKYTVLQNFKSHSEQICGRYAFPHNCDKCTRNFFTEKSLKVHERVHKEDVTVYKCDTCDKTYLQLRGLQHHVTSSGHESVDVSFSCKVCREKFPSRAELDKHAVTHSAKGSPPLEQGQTELDTEHNAEGSQSLEQSQTEPDPGRNAEGSQPLMPGPSVSNSELAMS